jgi:hypothetical protein
VSVLSTWGPNEHEGTKSNAQTCTHKHKHRHSDFIQSPQPTTPLGCNVVTWRLGILSLVSFQGNSRHIQICSVTIHSQTCRVKSQRQTCTVKSHSQVYAVKSHRQFSTTPSTYEKMFGNRAASQVRSWKKHGITGYANNQAAKFPITLPQIEQPMRAQAFFYVCLTIRCCL